VTKTGADDERPPFAIAAPSVLEGLNVDSETGLDPDRVAALRESTGYNELAKAAPAPLWRKFARQFADLVIWILIAAAVISGALGEWVDTLAILAIVLLNAVIGFVQEERAGRALAALRGLSAPVAKVVRGGVPRSLPARELVPGDVVELEAGDNVPADARLVRAFALRVQEAALTGESVPAEKQADLVLARDAALGDRRNMAYLGTVVAAGRATAVVTATGMRTELGRIAGLLGRGEPEPTPLQRRLAALGRVLIVLCLGIVGVVFALQMLRGGRFAEVFLLSVTIAVAAVPEGLPAVVTIALALGLQRMVRRNALIRHLPSVETLGSVTVICSDKTGTLTRNEMTVREVVTAGDLYRVSGVGYAPQGQFLRTTGDGEDSSIADVRAAPDLAAALEVGARCNDSRVVPRADGVSWEVIGDPTEGALRVAAMKAGIDMAGDHQPVLHEIPFDSERKAMSVVMRAPDGAAVMYMKGAPEVVLGTCVSELRDGTVVPLTGERRRAIARAIAELAGRALRVLGMAYRRHDDPGAGQYPEADLVFAGLVGMIDPPREEAKEAVRRCRAAGIRPVMITGDHPATALAVARELGIAAATDEPALTGRELDELSDADLAARVDRIPVYARVSAEHKLRVVRAWKARGEVVAMTGDGVNDAPAVKAADIGIAMGLTGTDVTREASDMVLTDDNFASIVNAVEEGRGIYENIQKVLLYLLSCNLGEILLLLGASLVGWPAPLLPAQVLWINLVTDGIPALALSVERAEPGVMDRAPRPVTEPILSRATLLSVLFRGLLVGGVGLAAFAVSWTGGAADAQAARAMAFCTLVYAELLMAMAARSSALTLGELGFFGNPAVLLAVVLTGLLQAGVVSLPLARSMFDESGHSWGQWMLIGVLAAIPLTVIETVKLMRPGRRRGHPRAPSGADSRAASSGGQALALQPASRAVPEPARDLPPRSN
jgi:Ca2+-transporting ATPase